MDAQPGSAAHLQLDRRWANLHFASWRLNNAILHSEGCVTLPAPAAPPQASDTDYVTARHAALLNGITQQPRGCYVFLEGKGEGPRGGHLQLHQIELGEPSKPPQLHRLCELPAAQQDAPAGGLTTGGLPPSVVEVQAAGSSCDASTSCSSLLLLSSGHGDVMLAVRRADGDPAAAGPCALSAPAFPLRPAPPLRGVRPVHLAAAFLLPTSFAVDPPAAADVCCILWAPRPRSERQPSRCEVYAVRLAAEAGATPRLAVREVQLLKVSDLPPHGVLVNPTTGGVLLALQPCGASAEEEAGAQRAAAEAAAGRPPAAGDDDGDDLSPRSLQAAVARLAAYTSEEPVGPLPHQQYADLYRETGADGVGAMGSEPTCTLFTYVLAGSQAGSSGANSEQPLLRLAYTLSCQPHKLLTCHLEQPAAGAQQPPTPDTHLHPEAAAEARQGRGGGRFLLGLTDDVDCAVVAISCLGPASSSGGGAAGEEQAAAGFAVEHVASVPALAYVAAGKVQRKFLLLAPPGGDIAAALVEATKYAYIYRATAPRQEYGEHQVVDMELPDGGGRGLLGAVLAGGRAGACRLVLLAREGLRVMDM